MKSQIGFKVGRILVSGLLSMYLVPIAVAQTVEPSQPLPTSGGESAQARPHRHHRLFRQCAEANGIQLERGVRPTPVQRAVIIPCVENRRCGWKNGIKVPKDGAVTGLTSEQQSTIATCVATLPKPKHPAPPASAPGT